MSAQLNGATTGMIRGSAGGPVGVASGAISGAGHGMARSMVHGGGTSVDDYNVSSGMHSHHEVCHIGKTDGVKIECSIL